MTNPKKIILVQLYSNGDCLYATTIARQIKTDFPTCHLTWAIASFCKSIIENNCFVDEILEIDFVKKNDVRALRKLKQDLLIKKKSGEYAEIYFVHNADTNLAYYDGSIRSNIFRAYKNNITVPIKPVLRLSDTEILNVNVFAKANTLNQYDEVVLFEYAPQSGQLNITLNFALKIAEGIVKDKNVAVILSSANKIIHSNKAIIDGSTLSLRETAALTHHCTFLLGTSSGITWISTSEAGKMLPMVQLFCPFQKYENPISRDFERFNISTEYVIELLDLNENKIIDCVIMAFENFIMAKEKFNEDIPLHFKTTRSIVYNLLCYFEFGAILTHLKVNHQVYGNNLSFYKEFIISFVIAPVTLVKNIINKRILKK